MLEVADVFDKVRSIDMTLAELEGKVIEEETSIEEGVKELNADVGRLLDGRVVG